VEPDVFGRSRNAAAGAGRGTLPTLVRKQQDDAAELRSLDKSLLGEVSKRAEQRDAKREQLLRQHRQELAEELARSSARLAAEFPDYAELVNPKPLSLAQAQKLLAPGEALVLFRGPAAYISPSCYPSKRATGKVVPTWPHVAVPAYGPLQLFHHPRLLPGVGAHPPHAHEGDPSTPMAAAGAADSVSAVCRSTILQSATPDRMRGRMSSVFILVVAGGPRLGDVESGSVAALVGAQASVVLGGLACVAGLVPVLAAYPAFWQYDEGGASATAEAPPSVVS